MAVSPLVLYCYSGGTIGSLAPPTFPFRQLSPLHLTVSSFLSFQSSHLKSLKENLSESLVHRRRTSSWRYQVVYSFLSGCILITSVPMEKELKHISVCLSVLS